MGSVMGFMLCYFFILHHHLLNIESVEYTMKHYLNLPSVENSFYDHRLRYSLHDDIYFVFGSNLKGAHGAGAALTAYTEYGALYGQGLGFAGMSYGIPTKNHQIKTLPLSEIELYVDQFVRIAQTSGKHFFVTAVGTGLAGYSHQVIAPMFKGVRNCWLPEIWKPYV